MGRIQAAFIIFNICLGGPAQTKAPGSQYLSLCAVQIALWTCFLLLAHESRFLFLEVSVSALSVDWLDRVNSFLLPSRIDGSHETLVHIRVVTTTVICGVMHRPVCTTGRAVKANACSATQKLRLDLPGHPCHQTFCKTCEFPKRVSPPPKRISVGLL